ncbi:uncharacterized protein LOC111078226 [Drosophila obscura]|uniref:uncharacterized protein LOC111078226 n=1 Tax=Drosophila obscura TaxID=7282 RepID=UPI001BB28A40|nr:uncharacterized protein LOC111078226 [Drosophila obscura]
MEFKKTALNTANQNKKIIYDHLYSLKLLDNEEKTAQNFADWILNDMDICSRGAMIEALFVRLRIHANEQEPHTAVGILRVLSHVTTHCTDIKVQHMALWSNALDELRKILQILEILDTVVSGILDLASNFIACSWMIRDAFQETGLLDEILKNLYHPSGMDAETWIAKSVVLLYQFLKHKTPGPPILALVNIAKALAYLLMVNQDAIIVLPLLKITRLVAEHQSDIERVMIKTGLLAKAAPFVLSPLCEVKREAIFILANTCQQYGPIKRHLLCRFPSNILKYMHHLFGHRSKNIRTMALHLLTGIIDNRAIDPSLMDGLIPMVIRCASKREHHLEVRLAAGWTLASLALHLNIKGMTYFMHSGGVHQMCHLLQTVDELPIQLIRNILTSFLKIWESFRDLSRNLVAILRECGIMDDGLQRYIDSENYAVRTLAILLAGHRGYDICWVEVLANVDN